MDKEALDSIYAAIANAIACFVSGYYKEALDWADTAEEAFEWFIDGAEIYALAHLPPDNHRNNVFWFRDHPYDGYCFNMDFDSTPEEYLDKLRRKVITQMGFIRHYLKCQPIISFDWYKDTIWRRNMASTADMKRDILKIKWLINSYLKECFKPELQTFRKNKRQNIVICHFSD